MLDRLRARVPHEEFDYAALIDGLRSYARPRDHITTLLRRRAIIRVKKGLYVFGPTFRRAPFSRELLANLIYGPSYVSLEWALSFYGFIPEGVDTVTSVTTAKPRVFATPVGRFTYWPVPEAVFWMGIDRMDTGDGRAFLMATREKALCDLLVRRRRAEIRTLRHLETCLAVDLRIDLGELHVLDAALVGAIARRWRSRRLRLLAGLLARFREPADE